jgi:hypothetical protein
MSLVHQAFEQLPMIQKCHNAKPVAISPLKPIQRIFNPSAVGAHVLGKRDIPGPISCHCVTRVYPPASVQPRSGLYSLQPSLTPLTKPAVVLDTGSIAGENVYLLYAGQVWRFWGECAEILQIQYFPSHCTSRFERL